MPDRPGTRYYACPKCGHPVNRIPPDTTIVSSFCIGCGCVIADRCEECDGTGEITGEAYADDGVETIAECANCGGEGYIIVHEPEVR